MVFYFSFLLLKLVSVLPSLHPLLLNRLLCASHFWTVLSSNLLQLLLLKLVYFVFVVVNVFLYFLLVFFHHRSIRFLCIFFITVTDSQFSLQKLDFSSVVSLIVVVSLHSADYFLTHFFISLILTFILCNKISVHCEPLVIWNFIFAV